MPIYKGSTKFGTVYHGGTKIGKVYKGSSLVYSSQLSVYNIYATNQVQNRKTGFFLGEPGANKIVVGGLSDYAHQATLTYVLGTIKSISGTPGTAGSSLIARLYGTGDYGPLSYLDNYIDSYGSVWYRYTNDPTGSIFTAYVLLSPFHTTVGSELINTPCKNAVFSSDASTITFYDGWGQSVYNAASTLIGTFQYK